MSDAVKLEIATEVVRPIIEAQIQAAIVRELNNTPNLVEKMIEAAMLEKVSSDGRKSNYSSDNRYSYIDVLAQKAIRDSAQQAMQEWIKENQAKLKRELKRQLASHPEELAASFIAGLTKSAESDWRMTTNITLRSFEDE